jgi:hypothetical protein
MIKTRKPIKTVADITFEDITRLEQILRAVMAEPLSDASIKLMKALDCGIGIDLHEREINFTLKRSYNEKPIHL